jgi:hypothetical protein
MSVQLTSTRLKFYQRSLVTAPGMEFGLAQTSAGRKLAVLISPGLKGIDDFWGETTEIGAHTLLLCPLISQNAKALRNGLSWLKPRLLGLKTSAGMGDRMGIATPGHVRAVRHFQGKITPIFAQQSIREMKRTARSPQQVMDDATWGAFEEGWQSGVGADADHLKTFQDIDVCLAAGFTFFTFDPGEYVNHLSESVTYSQLSIQLEGLPTHLQPEATGLIGKSFDFEGYKLIIDERNLLKAVVKYGKALAHVVAMYEYLAKVAGKQLFEVEVSMDETEQPTSPLEHVYIASELSRLGVRWVSFAPRFVGRFEKGVDYIGDLHAFEKNLAVHASIARWFGPYKLSLHSGSDKFSIYSIFMEATKGLSHLKTAGTSYLEALRTIATLDWQLFKEIYIFARQHFERDRLSYHISAQISQAPEPAEIHDWPALLEQFDAREILHVTFGSVLTEPKEAGEMLFYDRIMEVLEGNREVYFDYLEKHFKRHLQPFSVRIES